MKRLIITLTVCLIANFTIAQNPAFKVEKKGSGSPMFFLPGFTCPGSIWDETIENLEDKYESHIFTYAGFAGVEPIEMPWYETIKIELIDYIKKENLSDITIIGHSMGGTLAMDVASELPIKIKSLILVDAIPCMREVMMPGIPANQIQYDSPYNNQMLSMNEDAFKGQSQQMAGSMTANSEKVDTITNWILEADRKTYVYGYTDLLKLDLREQLGNIKAKVLILGAPFPNREMVKANYEKQYAKMTNKTIEIASDSRHFIMFDQPEWFYENINTFLAE